MFDPGLTDRDLFPLLTDAGESLLRTLRQHPHAPKYNWRTGDRLTAPALARVRAFAASLDAPPSPDWLPPFLARCRATVPHYRNLPSTCDPADLSTFPVLTREQLRTRPWDFVPDDLPVGDLITYTTSGTSGTALTYFATPDLPSSYLPLYQHALRHLGITLTPTPAHSPNRVALVHVCAQQGTVVLCSVSAYLNGAGFAKINLDPADWSHPDDPLAFLNDLAPPLYTGDPYALHRLADLPLAHPPLAAISSGAALSDPLRVSLSARLRCPVVDVYSMNETGPISFSLPNHPHRLFPHPLHAETVGGQLLITGGLNPALPLIRYATGDRATLSPDGRTLTSLQARPPTTFRRPDGSPFHPLDLSTRLAHLPLAYIHIHQHADLSVHATLAGPPDALTQATTHLHTLFTPTLPLKIDILTSPPPTKRPTYSSDLPPT